MKNNQRKMIVASCVHELLEHGFLLTVDHGGDDWEISRSSDANAVLSKLMVKIDERLIVMKDDNIFGWVHFLHDDNARCVICDMTVSVAPYICKTTALTKSLV